jgi:5'(3')-deoxyribonucleotidase
MTIFLDMDGVIADFFSAFAKKNNVSHWKSIKQKEKALADLVGTDWFNQLPTFKDDDIDLSKMIVNHVRDITDGDWGICSSPLRGDHNNSAYWKRVWLQDHDFMPEVERCIFTSNKHKYAVNRLTGKPNILIDDKIDNIKRWEQAGGIGIRFQADQDDVVEYLFKEIENVYQA